MGESCKGPTRYPAARTHETKRSIAVLYSSRVTTPSDKAHRCDIAWSGGRVAGRLVAECEHPTTSVASSATAAALSMSYE